ncbi:MAG: FAD-dependent thymidylate synthase [Deltaproteobacteria bacterium]|jgi:thymidylate synthase (FAD)|nr:FAD-dependent thymidylate synthase [Deltaproteobacteria bacterium]
MPQVEPRVELLAHTPDALSIIYAAFRQCYHAGFVGDLWEKLVSGEVAREKQAEFVEKLLESGHVSPIEHVTFTFAVSGVSRALTHQLVRHRVASYSQQSQRYVDGSDFNYIVPPAIMTNQAAKRLFEKCMLDLRRTYRELKYILEENGRAEKAAEDARFVLPQAAETRVVLSMNCRSLLNFFEQRCCNRAQWEIRRVAFSCLKLCREVLPAIFASAGARCEKLGYCPEGEKFTCGRYPLPRSIA